jgi:hypothetical protein
MESVISGDQCPMSKLSWLIDKRLSAGERIEERKPSEGSASDSFPGALIVSHILSLGIVAKGADVSRTSKPFEAEPSEALRDLTGFGSLA